MAESIMKTKFLEEIWADENEAPTGGVSSSKGVAIYWQDGPLGRNEDKIEPNGAFVETVIDLVISRLLYYQDTKFSCEENDQAISHLKKALSALNSRTDRREKAGTEGTLKEE